MARRDDAGGLTFELVPDDGDDLPATGTAPVRVEAAGTEPVEVPPSLAARALRVLRSHPRTTVASAVALALVAAGGVVAVVLPQRQRDAALTASPGAVVSLSEPIHSVWTSDAGHVPASPGPWPVAAFRDVVVVSERASPSSTVLRGIDLGAGTVRWSVTLDGADAVCGTGVTDQPQERLSVQPVRSLVCVTGTGAGSRVVVVDDAGRTTRRTPAGLDAGTRLRPGPDGSVLRVQPDGTVPDGVRVVPDSTDGWVLSESFQAPTVTVSAEDARTGSVGWSQTVEGGRLDQVRDWWSCSTWGDDGTPKLDPGAVAWTVSESVVAVQVCGAEAAFTASGAPVLEAVAGTDGFGQSMAVESLPGGRVRVPSGAATDGIEDPIGPARVVDQSGAVVADLEGGVLDPRSTDGSTPGVLLTHDGTTVSAVGRDGATLWTVPETTMIESLVAQARGVAVVARPVGGAKTGELAALDLATGKTLWTASLGKLGSTGSTVGFVHGAWTDGRSVVVSTPGDQVAGRQVWAALDLRTGDVLWKLSSGEAESVIGPTATCLAVAGRLLCVEGSRLVRIS